MLASKITPLQNFVDELTEKNKEIDARYAEALKLIKEKDKVIQKYELIQYQYEQLQRLVYSRSTEKSSITPGQLLLELHADTVETSNIGDRQKIQSYTKVNRRRRNTLGAINYLHISSASISK